MSLGTDSKRARSCRTWCRSEAHVSGTSPAGTSPAGTSPAGTSPAGTCLRAWAALGRRAGPASAGAAGPFPCPMSSW